MSNITGAPRDAKTIKEFFGLAEHPDFRGLDEKVWIGLQDMMNAK